VCHSTHCLDGNHGIDQAYAIFGPFCAMLPIGRVKWARRVKRPRRPVSRYNQSVYGPVASIENLLVQKDLVVFPVSEARTAGPSVQGPTSAWTIE